MFSPSKIRIVSSSAKAGSKTLAQRQFHAYSKVLNETVAKAVESPVKPQIEAPKKKSHPVRKFFLRLTLATIVFYGAGSYLSLKNDTFNDYFTEYVPLADELVQTIEDNKKVFTESDLMDLKKKISDLKDKTVTVPQQGALSEKISDVYAQVKTKSEGIFNKGPVVEPQQPAPNAAGSSEPKYTASENNVVPKLALPTIDYQAKNPDVNAMVEKVNALISSINNNTAVPTSTGAFNSLISNITHSIETISDKVKGFEKSKEDLITDITNKLTSENAVALKEKENELIQKFLGEFNREISKIRTNYEQTLAHDIDLTRKNVELELENKLKLAQIQQLKDFEDNLADKIDSERNGKLKDLNELAKKIQFLENFEVELFKNFEKFTQYNELNLILNDLKKLVFYSETYQNNLNELNGAKILDQVNKLAALTGINDPKNENGDSLIAAAVKALPTDSIKSTGLLSNAQLIQRWNLLTPELRSAALLPPNAGLLGHLSAKFFSYFLISKNGSIPTNAPSSETKDGSKPLIDTQLVGNDIESVIANVNYKLTNGDLDDAIEIVSGLKGWGRKLSNDWLTEARKKLEIEFLVDLLESEIKYSY